MSLRRDERAVTPIVGTIMILAITILGIGSILFWGLPAIQAIQDETRATSMEAEFLDMRLHTRDLTIDQTSRVPTVNLQKGSLVVEDATKLAIGHDAFSNPHSNYDNCEMIVSGWNSAPLDTFQLEAFATCSALLTTPTNDCSSVPTNFLCVEVKSVIGPNEKSHTPTITVSGTQYDVTVAGQEFNDGDWVIRLRDDTGEVMAETWLFDGRRINWRHDSSSGVRQMSLEAGAVFAREDESIFLTKGPILQEDSSGQNDFFLRLPTFLPASTGSFDGDLSLEVFLGMVGNNHVRIDSDETTKIRWAFDGELAEGWCNSLLLRNNQLTSAAYSEPTTNSCTDAVPTLTYALNSGAEFSFEMLHARITARIQN